MNIVTFLKSKPILSICLLVFIMLGFSIQYLDVTIMEARNFITAREMIYNDHWLLTTMNGEARYQKPPLPSWLTAISAMILGINNLFAMRLPAIIMVMLTAICSYRLSVKLLDNTTHSFNNALITMTSLYVVAIIIEAPSDIFTHGFMLASIYYLFSILQSKSLKISNILIASICFGASILSKGPVSPYALFLPFVISYGIVYGLKPLKRKILPLVIVVLLGIVIGGWWYLYVRVEDPITFAKITSKETGNWGSYNVRPFYYYWSFFTQSGLWTIPAFISLLYPYLKSRVSNLKAYRFSFYWTIAAVVLLSIIPEKKSRYLMPVLIPLAINIGFYIEYLIQHFKTLNKKTETFPVYFNFGLIGSIGLLFPVIGYIFFKDYSNVNWIRLAITSVVLVYIGVQILRKLKAKNMSAVFYNSTAFFIAAFMLVIPLTTTLKDVNYTPISNLKNELETQKLKLYSLNYVSPEMIWQYGDKISGIKTKDSLFVLPKDTKFGLLSRTITKKDLSYLESNYTIEKLSTYDLNVVKKDSRKYRNRLMNHLYIMTQK